MQDIERSGISHAYRTPLATLQLAADWVEQKDAVAYSALQTSLDRVLIALDAFRHQKSNLMDVFLGLEALDSDYLPLAAQVPPAAAALGQIKALTQTFQLLHLDISSQTLPHDRALECFGLAILHSHKLERLPTLLTLPAHQGSNTMSSQTWRTLWSAIQNHRPLWEAGQPIQMELHQNPTNGLWELLLQVSGQTHKVQSK